MRVGVSEWGCRKDNEPHIGGYVSQDVIKCDLVPHHLVPCLGIGNRGEVLVFIVVSIVSRLLCNTWPTVACCEMGWATHATMYDLLSDGPQPPCARGLVSISMSYKFSCVSQIFTVE